MIGVGINSKVDAGDAGSANGSMVDEVDFEIENGQNDAKALEFTLSVNPKNMNLRNL